MIDKIPLRERILRHKRLRFCPKCGTHEPLVCPRCEYGDLFHLSDLRMLFGRNISNRPCVRCKAKHRIVRCLNPECGYFRPPGIRDLVEILRAIHRCPRCYGFSWRRGPCSYSCKVELGMINAIKDNPEMLNKVIEKAEEDSYWSEKKKKWGRP